MNNYSNYRMKELEDIHEEIVSSYHAFEYSIKRLFNHMQDIDATEKNPWNYRRTSSYCTHLLYVIGNLDKIFENTNDVIQEIYKITAERAEENEETQEN